jgi:hypothetical protein
MLAISIDYALRRGTVARIVNEHRAAILVIVEATDVRGAGSTSVRGSACRQASQGNQQHQNCECFCHG